jgi:DNA-binding PadR family transcriptional regulator
VHHFHHHHTNDHGYAHRRARGRGHFPGEGRSDCEEQHIEMAGHGSRGPHFGHRGGRHGFGGGWGGEHGGRRRRIVDSGELRLVLLALIQRQPRHGYDLIRAIDDLTAGNYVPSPGMVYPTLSLLQEMGLIEEAASEGARRPFQVTTEGSDHLASRKAEVEALFARLSALAGAENRSDAAPVRRAMENLRTALGLRLQRDDLQGETLHEIAAILDEAARKIERT